MKCPSSKKCCTSSHWTGLWNYKIVGRQIWRPTLPLAAVSVLSLILVAAVMIVLILVGILIVVLVTVLVVVLVAVLVLILVIHVCILPKRSHGQAA